MKEIPVGSDVAAIESSVKNKWRWAWLTEDEDGAIFGTWCKKTNQLGACLCMVCHKSLTYETSGKRALVLHARDQGHKVALLCAKRNWKLDEQNDIRLFFF